MAPMITVSESEFEQNLARYRTLAMTEAVAVTSEGHERTVLISIDEYRRLVRRERRVMGLNDFTAADIAAIEAARAPEAAKAFDDETMS